MQLKNLLAKIDKDQEEIKNVLEGISITMEEFCSMIEEIPDPWNYDRRLSKGDLVLLLDGHGRDEYKENIHMELRDELNSLLKIYRRDFSSLEKLRVKISKALMRSISLNDVGDDFGRLFLLEREYKDIYTNNPIGNDNKVTFYKCLFTYNDLFERYWSSALGEDPSISATDEDEYFKDLLCWIMNAFDFAEMFRNRFIYYKI